MTCGDARLASRSAAARHIPTVSDNPINVTSSLAQDGGLAQWQHVAVGHVALAADLVLEHQHRVVVADGRGDQHGGGRC
jgi:hypothetical protein